MCAVCSLKNRDTLKVYHSSYNGWWWSPLWKWQLRGADPQPRWSGESRNVPLSVAQFPPPPLHIWMELHLSANQPRFKLTKCLIYRYFYLLKPHNVEVELVLEPPFLVHHVGGKFTSWFWHRIFASVHPSQLFQLVTTTHLHNSGALPHHQSLS